jgi:hypothetical protein
MYINYRILFLFGKSGCYMHELLLHEEASWDVDAKCSAESALLAVGGTTPKVDNNITPPPPPNRSNNTNNNFLGNNGRGHGGHGGRGHGHGGRNNGCSNGGRGNNSSSNIVPNRSSPAPWGQSWGSSWRAPWTGTTGPGLLSSRPPLMPA